MPQLSAWALLVMHPGPSGGGGQRRPGSGSLGAHAQTGTPARVMVCHTLKFFKITLLYQNNTTVTRTQELFLHDTELPRQPMHWPRPRAWPSDGESRAHTGPLGLRLGFGEVGQAAAAGPTRLDGQRRRLAPANGLPSQWPSVTQPVLPFPCSVQQSQSLGQRWHSAKGPIQDGEADGTVSSGSTVPLARDPGEHARGARLGAGGAEGAEVLAGLLGGVAQLQAGDLVEVDEPLADLQRGRPRRQLRGEG